MHTGEREGGRERENGKEVGYPSKTPVFASCSTYIEYRLHEMLKEICNHSTS